MKDKRKNGKTEKEKKEKKRELVSQVPIGYFLLFLSKSRPLPKTEKGVSLGTNHSGPLPSK